MLKDLNKRDWLDILSIPESRLPKVLILRGTRNLKSQYQSMLPHFRDIVAIDTPNDIVEDVLIGQLDGLNVGFACVYGAPMASEVTHIFGVLGTSMVIQTGCCGGLAEGLVTGDLFVVTEAYCGEGASQYYLEAKGSVSASVEVLKSALLDQLPKGSWRSGKIYTTSALLAQGQEELETWSQQGCAAVDMETAATFAVAEYFGMDRASILFVFDNPRQQEHMLLTDSDKETRRKLGDARMRDLVFQLARGCSRQNR